MFRKAAIVLALAASFLGAQAADLPKARELFNHKNKTKSAHGSTKSGNNVRAKAKTAQLCLGGAWDAGVQATGLAAGDLGSLFGNFEVFDCATITAAEPAAIGVIGFFCTYSMGAGSDLAPCTGQLTMNTNWHKTTSLSSVAASFWTSTTAWAGTDEQILEGFNIVAPVVTGTTGAWPSKVGAISNITNTFTEDLDYPYILNIAYKGRGWNPTYSK